MYLQCSKNEGIKIGKNRVADFPSVATSFWTHCQAAGTQAAPTLGCGRLDDSLAVASHTAAAGRVSSRKLTLKLRGRDIPLQQAAPTRGWNEVMSSRIHSSFVAWRLGRCGGTKPLRHLVSISFLDQNHSFCLKSVPNGLNSPNDIFNT